MQEDVYFLSFVQVNLGMVLIARSPVKFRLSQLSMKLLKLPVVIQMNTEDYRSSIRSKSLIRRTTHFAPYVESRDGRKKRTTFVLATSYLCILNPAT
jgi:hypothetical protein